MECQLDVMMNDDIKNSNAYQTYLALSIGTEVPKKGRKGKKVTATPRKKVEHQKKKMMKEIASEPSAAQELLNLKKGTRASREAYILQQIPKGSSEGSGVNPDVRIRIFR
nr:hypothetical protein [Tanacetum cinerariifolium]